MAAELMGIEALTGVHLAAYQAPEARVNILDGSVRSGKTVVSLIKWIEKIRTGPAGNLGMIGKTERTLKHNVLDPMMDMLGPRRMKLTMGSGEAVILGRRVYIYGANDAAAESKIRGVTMAGILGDELTLWPESMFAMALSRLSLPGAQLWGTTNPDAPTHWLMKRYLSRGDELDLNRHHFTIRDNPYLDPYFVTALEREYVGLWYQRYIEGLWVAAEGAIYDMLRAEEHLVEDLPWEGEPPAQLQTWEGVDYGTANPTVFLLGTVWGDPPNLYIHHEYRWDSSAEHRQKTDAEYAADHATWTADHGYAPKRIFVDPSAASFSLALWRSGERRVVPADNAVLDGIRQVSSLVAAGRIKFHRSTTEATWEELTGYSWDRTAQNRGEDKPVKVADHGPDALRYLVMGTRQAWRHWLRPEQLTEAR